MRFKEALKELRHVKTTGNVCDVKAYRNAYKIDDAEENVTVRDVVFDYVYERMDGVGVLPLHVKHGDAERCFLLTAPSIEELKPFIENVIVPGLAEVGIGLYNTETTSDKFMAYDFSVNEQLCIMYVVEMQTFLPADEYDACKRSLVAALHMHLMMTCSAYVNEATVGAYDSIVSDMDLANVHLVFRYLSIIFGHDLQRVLFWFAELCAGTGLNKKSAQSHKRLLTIVELYITKQLSTMCIPELLDYVEMYSKIFNNVVGKEFVIGETALALWGLIPPNSAPLSFGIREIDANVVFGRETSPDETLVANGLYTERVITDLVEGANVKPLSMDSELYIPSMEFSLLHYSVSEYADPNVLYMAVLNYVEYAQSLDRLYDEAKRLGFVDFAVDNLLCKTLSNAPISDLLLNM